MTTGKANSARNGNARNGDGGSADSSQPGNPITLTDKQRAVLLLMREGKSNTEIAEELGLTTHAVRHHVRALSKKLNRDNRVQIVVEAISLGLIPFHGDWS